MQILKELNKLFINCLFADLVPSAPKTVQTILEEVSTQFAQSELVFGHGTDNPDDEAFWLVCATLNIDPDEIENQLQQQVSSTDEKRIMELCETRISTRKPLAYLLNEAWFTGLKFYVDERVIVPRSHIGDVIADDFRPWIKPDEIHHVLDLCTGSGCIAIATAHYLPESNVDAVDISSDALEVARINIKNHQLEDRVHALRSDLFSGLASKQYDLILSNPPYVGTAEYDQLPAEYQHEPKLALHTLREGLEIPLKILSESGKFLKPNGNLIMEVGASALLLQDLLPRVPFLWLATESEETTVFLLTAAQLTEFQHMFEGLLH